MKEVLIGNASLWDFASSERCLLHVEVLFISMVLLFQVQITNYRISVPQNTTDLSFEVVISHSFPGS
jgi:hypothetical protein